MLKKNIWEIIIMFLSIGYILISSLVWDPGKKFESIGVLGDFCNPIVTLTMIWLLIRQLKQAESNHKEQLAEMKKQLELADRQYREQKSDNEQKSEIDSVTRVIDIILDSIKSFKILAHKPDTANPGIKPCEYSGWTAINMILDSESTYWKCSDTLKVSQNEIETVKGIFCSLDSCAKLVLDCRYAKDELITIYKVAFGNTLEIYKQHRSSQYELYNKLILYIRTLSSYVNRLNQTSST
jgi:hypothetical protein